MSATKTDIDNLTESINHLADNLSGSINNNANNQAANVIKLQKQIDTHFELVSKNLSINESTYLITSCLSIVLSTLNGNNTLSNLMNNLDLIKQIIEPINVVDEAYYLTLSLSNGDDETYGEFLIHPTLYEIAKGKNYYDPNNFADNLKVVPDLIKVISNSYDNKNGKINYAKYTWPPGDEKPKEALVVNILLKNDLQTEYPLLGEQFPLTFLVGLNL